MCNRYANKVPFTHYVEEFSHIRLPILSPLPSAAPNLEPRENIAPTDSAPILRPFEDGLELIELRWGLIPWFHKGTAKEWTFLTTNARVETLATTKTFQSSFKERRCLVPVSYFYEWTGEKGAKIKWAFSRPNAPWFCFAGIWDRALTKDGAIETFALVTTAAGPDMQPYHTRQPVILEKSDYAPWLKDAHLDPETVKPKTHGCLVAEKAST